MCSCSYQPGQYTCYWDERVREIWNQPSENSLECLAKITQVTLAALAFSLAFTLEWVLMGFSLAYRSIYPLEAAAEPIVVEEATPRAIALDEFHGVVDVHAPDGVPDAWLIEQMNNSPYVDLPVILDRCTFFGDAIQIALQVLAPNVKAHYIDLLRNDGVPEEGEARIEIYNYCASCLVAHDCRYPTALRDQDPLYQDFQGLSPLDKALVLLRLMAPEKEWRLTDNARNLLQRIQEKTLNMSRDQIFLRQIMAPVATNSELYPLLRL